ncbi:AEC family transporter [Tropicibacter oceani]|uniref:AEC family transporter n=1 Tax=Tropicibacter oceani TaxID=3058420 RepID=A0ABY8QEH1_9RHOB|nr:AEC family transporter [Tropicibacter oceani]WGW02904.1 AEC family transporter [Tropicibacter oceani]
MLDPLLSLLPIYLLLLLGAGAIKTRLIPPEALPHLSRFALVICMPVIVASAVMRAGDLTQFNWLFIAGYAAAALIVLAVGAVIMARGFGIPGALAAMMGMGMSSANTIFLGYPVALVLFPEQVDRLFAWIIVAENLVVIPVAIVASEVLSGEKGRGFAASLRQTLGQMMRSPVLIGLVSGLVIAGLDVPLPDPIDQTRALVTAAAPLLALFFVGGTVANARWRETGAPVLVIALGKLVLHPLVALGVLSMLPGIAPQTAIAGMVFAAMPMFAIFPILSARHGGAELASSALVVTTLLGALSVGALVLVI